MRLDLIRNSPLPLTLPLPLLPLPLPLPLLLLGLGLGLSGAALAQDQALELRNQGASPFGYARIADANSLEWQTLTLEAWITPTGPGVGSGPRVVAAKVSEGAAGVFQSSYELSWLPDGALFAQVSFTLGVIGVQVSTPPGAVPIGTGAFAAMTYDGDTLRIFVDGALAAEQFVGPNGIAYGAQDLLFGAGNRAASPARFEGILDEVRLWNSALSAGTIALHALCALESPNEPGLVSRWSFDGGDVTDTTGHGNDGVLEGTEWSFVADQQELGPPCPPLGASYCSPANANSTGAAATIGAFGSSAVSDASFVLLALDLPPGQFGYFLVSESMGALMPPGSSGIICLSGNIGRYNQAANIIQGPTGALRVDLSALPVNPPTAVVPGDSWNFQCWYRDVPSTSNFTDAVAVFFP